MKFLAGSESRFFDFMGNLTDKNRVAIIAHNDQDGLTSAVIAGKVVGKVDYLRFTGYQIGLYAEILKELKAKKINKILFLDLALDNFDVDSKEFEKFAEILVVDHHPLFKNIESEKTAFIKVDSSSAAYPCYYLFSKIQQVPPWIAAIGIIGDNPHVYNEKNAKDVFSDFGLGEGENLFKVSRATGFAILSLGNEKIGEIYELFMKAKSPSDLKSLEKYSNSIEKEMSKYSKKFDKEKEEHGDLIIFYYETTIKINPIFTNDVSLRFPKKTVVMIQSQKGERYLNISSRRQDKKVDCNVLLQKVIADIPESSAGGHKAAAGASVPKEYLAKFKENLILEYKNLKIS